MDLEELQEKLSQAIYDRKHHEAHVTLINNVMRKVLDQVDIEFRENVIADAVTIMYDDLEKQVRAQDLTMDVYLKYHDFLDMNELRQHLAAEVRTTNLEYATLDEVAKKESITLSEEEFITAQKAYLDQQADEKTEIEDESDFRTSLLYSKVVDYLVQMNTTVE